MSFIKKLVNAGAVASEIAAPIVGGALGGPAGAAAGQAIAGGIKGINSKVQGPKGTGGFTPSSASSIEDARGQDRARMHKRYGMSPYGVPTFGPGGSDV